MARSYKGLTIKGAHIQATANNSMEIRTKAYTTSSHAGVRSRHQRRGGKKKSRGQRGGKGRFPKHRGPPRKRDRVRLALVRGKERSYDDLATNELDDSDSEVQHRAASYRIVSYIILVGRTFPFRMVGRGRTLQV